MLGHLSQVSGLKPSALGCAGVWGRRRKASDDDIVETSFAGSRSMLEGFVLLQIFITTFAGYFLPNQLLF